MSEILEPSPPEGVTKRRTRLDPSPHFLPDLLNQYDAIHGCLELQIPADHEVRRVKAVIARLDLSDIEAKYSSLGSKGYPPGNTLAVWVYASQVGIHHSTALAARMRTDGAFLYLSGGYEMSEGHLRKFRRENLEFFTAALQQTLRLAHEDGLLRVDEIAVDSVRLRAEASPSKVRTVSRSTRRLKELEALDVASMDAQTREKHQAKLEKHQEALRLCAEQGRPNVVMTNPAAGLMKFPDGASGPGHRVTATVAGVSERFVVDIFVDAAGADANHSRTALMRMRSGLEKAGVPLKGASIVFDAGYLTHEDLKAADEARWAEVIIDVPERPRRKGNGTSLFNYDDFSVDADGRMVCPAGRAMNGPLRDGPTRARFTGVGCSTCPLKEQCTTAPSRTLTMQDEYVTLRQAMKVKRQSPEGKTRYAKRIATVEPVFSYLEDVMGYRRVSSRMETAALAEISLKALTYNLLRLRNAKRLACISLVVEARATGELFFELWTAKVI